MALPDIFHYLDTHERLLESGIVTDWRYLVAYRGVSNNLNNYTSVDVDSPGALRVSRARRWLDGRTILVALLALVLGAVSWISLATIFGHSLLAASFFEMLLWFVGIGFVSSCIDPRNPLITWMMVYTGTYVLNLPLFPPDPLLMVGLGINIFYTGIGVIAGALVPTLIAYTFPFRSQSTRRWAGYGVE